jgi:hypothetical protein
MRRTIASTLAILICGVSATTGVTAERWSVSKRDSAASGNMACSIMAVNSPLFFAMVKTSSGESGAFVTAVDGDDVYPGSTVYLAIDGERFSGEERILVTPSLLDALLRGSTAHIEWTPWPYGGVRETSASLSGFASVYDECSSFIQLRNAAAPTQPPLAPIRKPEPARDLLTGQPLYIEVLP